jgi:hypothetical protein
MYAEAEAVWLAGSLLVDYINREKDLFRQIYASSSTIINAHWSVTVAITSRSS